ncbi:MAG TPA: dienelactone hydrolase family protein [Acidimicrobiales bacterium]|nr:dienelactone hydrolase family protein [Acidimicrobiales bacterium]
MRTTLPSGRPVELVRPADAAVRGVVLVPDIFGLRPVVDDLATRLALDHGWAVCAVEPFPGNEHVQPPERLALIGANDDEVILPELASAADVLETERTAVLGFCQGGMWAFKAAGTGRFDRAVAFYGMVSIPWAREGHNQPTEFLTRPDRCPVLSIMGGLDKWTPEADVEFLRSLPDVEIALYPDADHAFAHDPARPTYRQDDADDAWSRTVAFLA